MANLKRSRMPGSLIYCAVLAGLCMMVYTNTLNHEFLHDDKIEILQNPVVRDLKNIPKAFVISAWGWQDPDLAEQRSNYYRPVQMMTYTLLYSMFGSNPKPFHIYKIILHALCVILVFLAGRQILLDEKKAFVASALFALHPMHVEAVTWISGVTDVGCTLFVLASFYFFAEYLRSGKRWQQGLSLICFLLGLFSKETAAMALPLFFLYEYLFPGRTPTGKAKSRLRYVSHLAGYVLLFGGYLVLRVNALGALAPEGKYPELSGVQAALNAFPLLARYLAKLIWPLSFNFHYSFDPVLSVGDGTLVLSFAFMCMVLWSAWHFRKRNPVFAFGILWTILTLVPVLHCQKLGRNVFAERYLYLPSVGFCFLAAGCFFWIARQNVRKIFVYVLLAAVVSFYSIKTFRRNSVLRDDLTLWRATAEASPGDPFVRKALGNAFAEKGLDDQAVVQYALAVAADPEFPGVHDNWANVLSRQGKVDQAIGHYRRALELDPDTMAPHINMGNALMASGNNEEARKYYLAAQRIAPESADPYNALGYLWATEGNLDQAREMFLKAIQLKPDDPMAYNYLGKADSNQGRLDEALKYFERAISLEPDFVRARYNASEILMRQGKEEAAEQHYAAILKTRPQEMAARYNLGNIKAHQRKLEEAADHYREVLKMDPRNLDARNNLAVVLAEQGRLEEAAEQFLLVLKMNPFYRNARVGLARARELMGK